MAATAATAVMTAMAATTAISRAIRHTEAYMAGSFSPDGRYRCYRIGLQLWEVAVLGISRAFIRAHIRTHMRTNS